MRSFWRLSQDRPKIVKSFGARIKSLSSRTVNCFAWIVLLDDATKKTAKSRFSFRLHLPVSAFGFTCLSSMNYSSAMIDIQDEF